MTRKRLCALDLAFLMPEEKDLELPHVDMAVNVAPVPAPPDDLVYLFPMARSLNREIGVAIERVRAVVKKPRTFVAADMFLGMQALGCPVFDASGRTVGLAVMPRAPRTSPPDSGFRDMFDSFTPVVLTAADVQDVATQALKQPAEPLPSPSPTPSATPSPTLPGN